MEYVSPAPPIDAAQIIGLMADPARRRVIAAMILGASSPETIAAAADLSVAATATALGRIGAAGLIVQGDGGLFLLEQAFATAARAAKHRADAAGTADTGMSAEQRKVFAAFVRDGRIVQIPVAESKRLVLLDWLAQDFEPGRRYTEKMVNLIIGKRHADTAAWRRYLVDHGFLDREHGEYWRSGGSVAVG